MTSGAAVGVGIGVVGVGGLAWWMMRARAAAPPTTNPLIPFPPPPEDKISSALRNPATAALNAFEDVNQAVCTKLVSAKAVPKALASAGCDIYGKFLSPLGSLKTGLALLEKVPVIGGPIRATEKAVTGLANQVASVPVNMIRNPAVIGSTALKVAAAPITVTRTALNVASNTLGIANSAVNSLPGPARVAVTAAAAPLKLAGATLSLPLHMATAVVQNPVKAVTTIAAAPVKAVSSVVKALKFW